VKTARIGAVGEAMVASTGRASSPTGERSSANPVEVVAVSEVEMAVDRTDSHEKMAAVIASAPAHRAALVSDIRAEQLHGIVKKLFGRHIIATPMTLREGARSNFADSDLVLIIPDVGSHSDIDAVIAAAEAAGKKWKTISRKSSQWDLSVADPHTFTAAVSRSMLAADNVLSRVVDGMKADGEGARILSYLTEGVKEYVFLAGAAKAHVVEQRAEARIAALEDDLAGLRAQLDKARSDDEAAHALFAETESQLSDLRAKHDEVCRRLEEKEATARALMERVQQAEHEARCRGQERDEARALAEREARRFEQAIADLNAQIVSERNAHVAALAAAESRAPTSVPVSGTDQIRRVVEAALGAVEAGLLSHEEALSRIAAIARRPS
jgi:hypothetical protein